MMESLGTFISLYGTNMLWLCGLVVVWWIAAAIAGITTMIFEKMAQPYIAFGMFLAIVNLVFTFVRFMESSYGG